MRINQYLALCGMGSRRSVEAFITDGNVTVNGKRVTELSHQVGDKDHVKFNGKICLPPMNFTYLAFYKPKGYICSRTDPQQRQTVYELLPNKYHKLNYVGRLDFKSHGLLLFTNDNAWAKKISEPDAGTPRKYVVKTSRALTINEQKKLAEGITLADGEKFRPVDVKQKKNFAVLTLTEGKNREIRKMMEHFGIEVLDLFRKTFGDVDVDELKPGELRKLTPEEINSFFKKKIR